MRAFVVEKATAPQYLGAVFIFVVMTGANWDKLPGTLSTFKLYE
jgi:hypothetical protein